MSPVTAHTDANASHASCSVENSGWLVITAGWLARLVVAAVFVIAAAPKLTDPATFALTIYRYDLLPASLIQPMAIFMPWLEILAALALVATPRWREAGSVVLAGLLLVFTVAAGTAVWRGLNISCGCFSSADTDPIGAWLFIRNGLLFGALALAVAIDRGWLQTLYGRLPTAVPTKALSLLLPGVFVIGLLLSAGGTPAMASTGTSETDVDVAIERMQRFLMSRQHGETGSWETRSQLDSTHYGHTTALVAWALLQSGYNQYHPAIHRSLEFLSEQQGGDPYTVYPRVLVWAGLPSPFLGFLERDAQHLARTLEVSFQAQRQQNANALHPRDLFYAVIALDAAAKRAVRIAPSLWEQVAQHLLRTQQSDGGWLLSNASSSASSSAAASSVGSDPMTSAMSLSQLYICQRRLADQPRMVEAMQPAIRRGLRFLDRNLTVNLILNPRAMTQSHEAAFHNLFLLERLGRYTGIQRYAETNWYRYGVENVLSREKRQGHIDQNLIETSFALLVLSQAKACVWINELRIPGISGDTRPGQIHRLTEALSWRRQHDLHWHAVNVDDPLSLWLAAPILYLSSEHAVVLDEVQMDRLKRYLDLGGLLVANPENGSPAFKKSIRELGERLYPGHTFQPAPDNHPSLHLLSHIQSPRLEVLSNAARDLILLLESDFVIPTQVSEIENHGTLMPFWYNVYAWTSEHGRIIPRLFDPVPMPSSQEPILEFSVIRAMHGDQWNVEPMAWQVFSHWIASQTPVSLKVEALPLSALSNRDPPDLVHLSGISPTTLSAVEIDVLKTYLDRGGTVLVETIGGQGEFARSIRDQLEQTWHTRAQTISARDSLYTVHADLGLLEPSDEVFRRYSAWKYRRPSRPGLAAIKIGERPALFFSDEDLTLALIGSRMWGIHGYSQAYAPSLMRAVLLHGAGPEKIALLKAGSDKQRLTRAEGAQE